MEASEGLTPCEVAKRLKPEVCAETVRRWIRAKRLRASNRGTRRNPRWVIYPTDIHDFERSLSSNV
jgi:transposase